MVVTCLVWIALNLIICYSYLFVIILFCLLFRGLFAHAWMFVGVCLFALGGFKLLAFMVSGISWYGLLRLGWVCRIDCLRVVLFYTFGFIDVGNVYSLHLRGLGYYVALISLVM